MRYQRADTTARDWLLLAAMLVTTAMGAIGLVWFVVWIVFRALKG